jgi:hypothetical protein
VKGFSFLDHFDRFLIFKPKKKQTSIENFENFYKSFLGAPIVNNGGGKKMAQTDNYPQGYHAPDQKNDPVFLANSDPACQKIRKVQQDPTIKDGDF